MKIVVNLDESETIDPIDPIGDIMLTDDTTTILEKSTYLDSWFDALITGLETVKQGKNIVVEIVEEPKAIMFEPWGEGMRIYYGDRTLSISQISEFTQALRITAKEFLNKFEQLGEFNSNNLFNVISDFVNKEFQPQMTG